MGRGRIDRILPLGVLLLATSGCFPYLFTVEPGVRGKVVEGRTGAAIVGADVEMNCRNVDASTVTAADGQFFIPGKQLWGVIMGAFDPMHFDCTLSITASRYEAGSVKFRTLGTGPAVTDVGEIRLKPVVSSK